MRLTPTEFAVLRELALSAGRVLTHRQLLQRVWGPEYAGESQYTRTFVQRLRSKLEDDPASPELILTEPGLGYRLRELDSQIVEIRRVPRANSSSLQTGTLRCLCAVDGPVSSLDAWPSLKPFRESHHRPTKWRPRRSRPRARSALGEPDPRLGP